ncbi:subtilisin-like protease SBT1.7 [Solanum tuberosum]|uniref:subtilisin-like protease SBT1.7 n=1 Tax=Solanum tuberosum TaxID=4113 RepID=UPI00073A0FEF|nr:PREDICTED: subtilisin-like protease SBT1.7 [Solanum tuberosum]
MDLKFISTFLCFVLLHSSKTFGDHFTNQSDLETYIVHLEFPDQLFSNSKDLLLWHQSFLPTNSNHSSRILYSYRHVFNGFAATLSSDEVREMEKKPGFVSARPQRIFQLHTTHTPSFLGLHQNVGLWNASNSGKGVIIGILDTGIAPQHPSFNDNGMPNPPLKWKGKCEFNVTTYCNKKLIGARNYVQPDRFPLDLAGHGTHTSSTAAGNFVDGANFFGNANGTAVGIAPRAHVAMYKVCFAIFCLEYKILAGLDAAIEDGVDVISLSLGFGHSRSPLYNDTIAIGAYSAMEKGIFVSCSAGNDGPGSGTVQNGAPWILTVGASTTDRKIRAVVILGNGAEYEGESAFQPTNFSRKLLPLVNGKYCDLLHSINVKGKIVLCDTKRGLYREQIARTVKSAGGAGMILMNNKEGGSTTLAVYDVFSMTQVSYKDGQEIINYMKSTSTPVATISYKGTKIGDKHAPTVAYFSSRGPCLQSQGILKPDIIGPGVNVLAAWPTPIEGETTSASASSSSTFNILSGTSMSCPHLAGVAALLKSAHPDWSPAAIKSAIMTTADLVNLGNDPIQDETLEPADLLAIGSGHVNPSRANDPGLIYDIQPEDYIPYLCGLNYTDDQVSIIVKKKVHCTSSIPQSELNYPSFSITKESSGQTYTRTVTNVGEAISAYTVKVSGLKGVEVTVNPQILKFTVLNQKASYNVTVKALDLTGHSQGYIVWSSDRYSVRSPIHVFPHISVI